MLAEERHAIILDTIRRYGVLRTNLIAKELKISTETIRKDLDELSRQKLLKRVHGGAVLPDNEKLQRTYTPFAEREEAMLQEKKKIAAKASELIEDGSSLALDSGTTSYELARILVQKHQNLTILTNSLRTALLLSERQDFTTILTGGIVTSDEKSLISEFAYTIPKQVHVTRMFLSTCGVSKKDGITDQRLDEVLVHRQMMEAAEQIIVLADNSKLGNRSLIHVCPLEDVDLLITDQVKNEAWMDEILENIGDFMLASTP